MRMWRGGTGAVARGGPLALWIVLPLGLLLTGPPALASQLSDLLFSKGMVDFNAGNFEEALEKFKEAAADEPNDPNIQFMLGSAYNKLGAYTDARQALEGALALDPQMEQVHYELGVALFKLDRLGEALTEFQRAQQFEPDRALVHYYQGFIYHELKQYDRSPPFFIRARELADDLSLTSHYYAGIAYFRRGEFRQAKREFEAAIAADPESDVAESARRFLTETQSQLEQLRPLKVAVGVTSEYDSNVISLPEGLRPQDVPELSRKGDFRENILASLEYRPLLTQTTTTGVAYTFTQSLHHQLSQFDLQSHGLSFSASHLVQPVQLRFDGAAELHFLAGTAFLQRNVVGPSLNIFEAPWLVTNLSYRFQTFRRFDDTLRDALNHSFGLQQFVLYRQGKGLVRVGGSFEAENADGPDFDFTGYEVSLGVFNPFFLGTPYELSLNLDYRFGERDYRKVDSRFLVIRDEHRRAFTIGLTKPLGRRFEVGARYTLIVNRSNVAAFDYDRSLVSIGLAFRF